MKQKTIIFDVDGVLADFVLGFTREIGAEQPWGERQNAGNWNFIDKFEKQRVEDAWSRIRNNPQWWINLPPLEDYATYQRIARLQLDHQVLFVTARSGINAQWQTQRWLRLQGIMNANVVVADKKGDVAAAVGAHYHIDDKPENAACVHWIADKKPCRSYFLDHEYRQSGMWLPPRIKRVSSVNQYLEDIENEVA